MMNIARKISFEKIHSKEFAAVQSSTFKANGADQSDKINNVATGQTKLIDLILFDGRSPDEAGNGLNIPTTAVRSQVRTEMTQLTQQHLTLKEN